MPKILIYLLYAMLLTTKSLTAQKMQNCFVYKVSRKEDTTSMGMIYPGIEKEFKYCRIYLNDSMFKEKGLFSKSDKATSDIFKINKGNWYLLVRGKWKKFYCKGEKFDPILEINESKFRLKALNTWQLPNEEFIEYQLEPMGNLQVSAHPIYVFSSLRGIVQVKIDGFLLERNDL